MQISVHTIVPHQSFDQEEVGVPLEVLTAEGSIKKCNQDVKRQQHKVCGQDQH